MNGMIRMITICIMAMCSITGTMAQESLPVTVLKSGEKKVDIFIGGKLFTSFLYPDTLEKPVLYPVVAANGTIVTRGFPLAPQPDEPTDHPHHLGVWLNFENVNGLDFWNNSFAIPKEKKVLYGWIKNTRIIATDGGAKGNLSYQASWTNHQEDILLEETTRFEFSGNAHQRIIDRSTVLTAATDVLFKDAKDGLLGIRLALPLQMPAAKDQQFKDDKGNVTEVKAGTGTAANGNYITSEGKQGNDVWSTRGRWCKVYGRMGADSISVVVIDHPSNPNYPTFWHARGYGLFAANPLGANAFTAGKTTSNLVLKKGESTIFRYRIIVDDGKVTVPAEKLNQLADEFAQWK